jgi:hypothetical protein
MKSTSTIAERSIAPVFGGILEMIGNTPMLELKHLDTGPCRLFVKMENMNPGGSIKDRIAVTMIEEAEASGALKPGSGLGAGALIGVAKFFPKSLQWTLKSSGLNIPLFLQKEVISKHSFRFNNSKSSAKLFAHSKQGNTKN